jgi:hypothetical protein
MFAPEVLEMLELMKASEIHGVVTREFSRLIRPEQYSDYALLDVFINTNTLLYLPDGRNHPRRIRRAGATGDS